MTIEIRRLESRDAHLLDHVADGVFDEAVQPLFVRKFFEDERHHLIVAINAGEIVGFISALDYVHPDKPRELWINEVGVAPDFQRQGLGRRLLNEMLDHGRDMGCMEAWLGTEEDNAPARGLYESMGGIAEPMIMYSFSLKSAVPR